MLVQVALCIAIPFLGTALGAASALFVKQGIGPTAQRILTGFAAGVMIAASVWSLLVPAIEHSRLSGMGNFSFLPAVLGFWMGILFLLALDHLVPHLHMNSESAEGPRASLSRQAMLTLAVTLHNLPEGVAVGVACAAWLAGGTPVSEAGALVLAIGIAIQNFPEGAIVSLPLRALGTSRAKSFGAGVLSGIVEPIGALAAIGLAAVATPALPYLLSFAAGAMVYVVVEELIPEMSAGEHSNVGTLAFSFGFTLMLALDVALG